LPESDDEEEDEEKGMVYSDDQGSTKLREGTVTDGT
jgi:hypothetical protein